MEEFNEMKLQERYKAGWKGGIYFKSLITHPAMNFESPNLGNGRFGHQEIKQGTPTDVWNQRRSK